jgi:hypothetical protein
MSLLEVLINPQGTEHELSEPGLVCSPASVAEIGEPQLKKRFFTSRFERCPPRCPANRLFKSLAWRRWVRLDADHPEAWSDEGERRRAHPMGGAR